MSDPGDRSEHSAVNWSLVEYAGNGLWCMEEDIYNPDEWGTLLKNWQTAKKAAEAFSLTADRGEPRALSPCEAGPRSIRG